MHDRRNACKTHCPTRCRAAANGARKQILGGLVVLGIGLSGCASSSAWKPFSGLGSQASSGAAVGSSMGTSFANTGKAVKNQFSSVSSAVTSAVSKTKTAISAPFSPASSTTTATAEGEEKSANNPLNIAPDILVFQGNYFESQGNYTKALDSYSRALQTEPKNAVALMSMARLYDRQQDTAKATEFYQRVIEASPNNADAYHELGNLAARSGDLKGAQENLSKAATLQPSNKTYRHALSGVLLDSGDPTAALSQMSQCETPAMAQYQMAYMHFQRKNIPATQQHLADALKIDPNLKPARDLLASIGGAQGVNGMIQQGQQAGQQAMGIYQQAGAVLGGITNSVQGVPGLETSAAPSAGLPASGTNLLGIPVQPLQVAPAINPVPPVPSQLVPGQPVSGQPVSGQPAYEVPSGTQEPGVRVRLGQ